MSTTQRQPGNRVCVVGAGALGLTTAKNLLEQGLQVTAFERNECVGGTWRISRDPEQTTALPSTRFNNSKELSSLTDFPMPLDWPTFPLTEHLEEYLNSYAKHFDVVRHIRFSTAVQFIERDEANNQWTVHTRNVQTGAEEQHSFDRVAVCNGAFNTKTQIKLKGVDKFAGEVLHSRQFTDASPYKGKNVLVIGVGATGADTTTALMNAGAGKLYLSHRAQLLLLPRYIHGVSFDYFMSRRFLAAFRGLGSMWPRAAVSLLTTIMDFGRKLMYPWLSKHPSFSPPRVRDTVLQRLPVISDGFAENLRDGHIQTFPGVQEITGPRTVTFTDGSVIEDVDVIVACTGYRHDFSIVRGVGNPTDPAAAPDKYERIKKTPYYEPDNDFARLYMGTLSEPYPESLAFLGHLVLMRPVFVLNDLASMALASVWSGSYPLPSAAAMRRDIDQHYDFVVDALGRGVMQHTGFRIAAVGTYDWLNRAAGTGVTERLASFSWAAWKTWWSDRKFYSMLMDGPDLPSVYRLFDTGRGRKPWAGAREYIETVDAEMRERSRKGDKENSKKTK